MSRITLDQRRYNFKNQYIRDGHEYSLTDWTVFDCSLLKDIVTIRKSNNYDKRTINDIIIMADTETSKKHPTRYVKLKDGSKKAVSQPNHIVCWTLTLLAYGIPLATLRGRKPSEFVKCIAKVHDALPGDVSYFFIHNLSYDWTFLERFIFEEIGKPVSQLNTKPHYPIQIEFGNGIILRDSLILLQRSLEKAAKDLNVIHQKATGSWDYLKIRDQDTPLDDEEWHYSEFDTLSGAECIEAYCKGLNKNLATLPLTATGIPRGDLRKIAKANRWRDDFLDMALDFDQYAILSDYVYHGGFTHGNRHYVNTLIREAIRCYDFASSYPYTMLAFKFPMSAFAPVDNLTVEHILKNMDDYAFFFKFIMVKPQLKNDNMPMPFLQYSKCTGTVNAVCDNGRIVRAEYAEIWITEYDLAILMEQYKFKAIAIQEAQTAVKQYLPRWFTDYVYELYKAKCLLKHGDPVLYNLSKAKLNSCYGMLCTRIIRDDFKEDYDTGEFTLESVSDPRQEYETEMKKSTTFLPYQWGVFVTSIATHSLFELGKCIGPNGTWYYSDTDSCYGSGWDEEKIRAYNEGCKKRLLANGYGAVELDGREYWLGVAESDPEDDIYTEFKYMGAKRYACRRPNGDIKITVAGVPKKEGAKCLKSLDEFAPEFVFPGSKTGKKTHLYIMEDIHIDERGNECGNSIDLTECDYVLDRVDPVEWEDLLEDEYDIIDYQFG